MPTKTAAVLRKRKNDPLKFKDETPKYTVLQVSKILNITPHTIRYYDDCGLIPSLARTDCNVRLFSEFDLDWLRIAHALRFAGLSIAEVKHYVELSLQGDSMISECAKLVFTQEKALKDRLKETREHFRVLNSRKIYYKKLLDDAKNADTGSSAR